MRGALVIGIDNYPGAAKLNGCVNDATALSALLKQNDDGTRNFSVVTKNNIQTRSELRAAVIKLFKSQVNTALFYFAGHGCINDRGGFIVTPDFRNYDEGISMDELLNIVNQSPIANKIIIIDCCHSGAFGNPVIIGAKASYLGEGITIITAARQTESALELNGHGVFTKLLIEAMEGGAADIEGKVTCAGLYTFIDRSLNFWQQRPQFKANVQWFVPLRYTKPLFTAETRLIGTYFDSPDAHYRLDPSYEPANADIANPENVAVFKLLLRMQRIGLVEPSEHESMYWTAQQEGSCRLTLLGKHYWKLVKEENV